MSVWTNWDPLEEVIVGDCPNKSSESWNLEPRARELFDEILFETKEDLDNLANKLTSLGVKVFRPTITNFDQVINQGDFVIRNPTFPIVPRDQYLVYGSTVYQTYTSMPDRYLDSVNYYDIFLHLFDKGHNWISQPPPVLQNFNDNKKWFIEGQQIYHEQYKNSILWHTATMFKCGDALITNNLGPGSELGLEWMRRNTNANIINNNNTIVDNWGHIDHGFYMSDDDTVFCLNKKWVPEVLRNKNVIELDSLTPQPAFNYHLFMEEWKTSKGKLTVEWLEGWISEWKGYSQEIAFESNNLVVDSKNIIFSIEQPKVFDLMSGMGINTHVCKMRHGLFWEAGVHCLTLDIKRKGFNRTVISAS
jgi:glycine amidinotransferase